MLNPVAFTVFGLDIYWYGLTYALGFLFSYLFIIKFAKEFGFKSEFIEDVFFNVMIFSVLFGRLFYVLFYNPIFYFNNFFEIIAVWHGGMSIHGGIFGVFVTLYYFSKKYKLDLFKLTDLFILPASLALAFGRLANFINQELVGKITTSSLGVIFPLYDENTRWPYQLFEGFKSLIIFEILFFIYFFKKLKTGVLTGLFLVFFSLGRFILDFLREPDILFFGVISLGQLLSLIYAIVGVIILVKSYRASGLQSSRAPELQRKEKKRKR